jgi:hypothetical protein
VAALAPSALSLSQAAVSFESVRTAGRRPGQKRVDSVIAVLRPDLD